MNNCCSKPYSSSGGRENISRIIFAASLLIYASLCSADLQQLLNTQAAWNSHENYSQTEIVAVEPTTDFDVVIPLTVVALKNSRWSEKEALQKIRFSEKIYSQCKISFSPITIVKTIHRLGPRPNVWAITAYVDVTSLVEKGLVEKPIVFLTDGELHGRSLGGFAYRKSAVGALSPLADTAVIFRSWVHKEGKLFDPKVDSPSSTSYDVMAHELGHILFDQQGHMKSTEHIMSERDQRSNYILDQHCKAARGFLRN